MVEGRPATTPTDAELVAAAIAGQNRGFDLLLARHLPSLLGFLRYLGAPTAQVEDLAQEAFLKVFRFLEQYDPSRSFTNWLFSIARHTYYDDRRKHAKERTVAELPTDGASHASELEDLVLVRAEVGDLLSAIPERDRFLLELRVFRELPFPEIATLLEETENNLRVRFHRIIARMRLTAEKAAVREG